MLRHGVRAAHLALSHATHAALAVHPRYLRGAWRLLHNACAPVHCCACRYNYVCTTFRV